MAEVDLQLLAQRVPAPQRTRPIVVIGAGGIVRSAHLPAYRRLGFEVAGLYDVSQQTARETARIGGVPVVFESIDQAIEHTSDAVFDVAVPASELLSVVERLPFGSAALLQKPLGRDLAEARLIAATCERRNIAAAMNFQLRFSPNMLALKDAIARGWLGEIVDAELRVNVHTPWERWAFLRGLPRHELLYHSIHYLDAFRWLLGEPEGAWCQALRHPLLPNHADTRSTIILDYAGRCRCSLVHNHSHDFGGKHAASMLRLEGTEGAAALTLGVNLDYPGGRPDEFEFCQRGDTKWRALSLRGSWFTEAFEGPMSELQRFVADPSVVLTSPVADALRTMALVETCYQSSALPSHPVIRV